MKTAASIANLIYGFNEAAVTKILEGWKQDIESHARHAALTEAAETASQCDPAHNLDGLNSMMATRIKQAILALRDKEKGQG